MLEILGLGLLMGIAAAFAVGPIFILIIQEAVTRGFKASFGIILGSAVADLILLLPAVAFVWIIQFVANSSFWVGIIGAIVFCFLGCEAAREAWNMWQSNMAPPPSGSWSFLKGIVVNLANPLTWTFWLATGGPTMHRSFIKAGYTGVILFTIIWFGVAVAVETGIALTLAQSKRLVRPRGLAVFSSVSSVVFFGLAGWLLITNVIIL